MRGPPLAHLEGLVLEVHLQQRVAHQVSEATAIEEAVWPCVVPAVVDLRELQASVVNEIVTVEILVVAQHLLTERDVKPPLYTSYCKTQAGFSDYLDNFGLIFALACIGS